MAIKMKRVNNRQSIIKRKTEWKRKARYRKIASRFFEVDKGLNK